MINLTTLDLEGSTFISDFSNNSLPLLTSLKVKSSNWTNFIGNDLSSLSDLSLRIILFEDNLNLTSPLAF
jgi:hypothetical protein